MKLSAATVVLAGSVGLLVAVVATWVSGAGDRRSDLDGESVRRTASQPSTSSVAKAVPTTGPSISVSTSLPASVSSGPGAAPAGEERPAFPTRLSIPSLDVDATVVAVGLEPDGSMEIPGATEAGWYHYGARPGDAEGSAVIAAHVDHLKQPGVFINLRRLEIGSDVSVLDADGRSHHFVVTERFQIDKDELPSAELFRTTGEPTLTLITCGGKFSPKARSYADNIVVRATWRSAQPSAAGHVL
jgi:LPXTG-site transpeptidase (sortase) family protein